MPGAAALVGCTLCFQDGLALDGALDGHMALCCRRPVPSVSDRVAWVAQRLVVPRDCHDGDGDVRVGRRRSRRLLAMANMVTLTLFCCLVKVGYGRREPRPGATYLTLTNSSVAPRGVSHPTGLSLGSTNRFPPTTTPAAIVTNANMLVSIVLGCVSGEIRACLDLS